MSSIELEFRSGATRNAVERDGAEAEVERRVGAVVVHHDGGRIERRIGIDVNFIAVSKAQVGDFIVAEAGGSVVAEIVHVGARTACLHIVAETAVKFVGTVAAVQLIVARVAVQDVVACVACERIGAGAAVEDVVVGPAVERVISGIAVQRIDAGAAAEFVISERRRSSCHCHHHRP